MSFCLEDGSPLAPNDPIKPTEMVTEEYGANTEIRSRTPAPETVAYVPVSPAARPRRSNAGVYVAAAILISGVLIVVAAAIGGFWWYKSKRTELAFADNSNFNTAVISVNANASTPNTNELPGVNSNIASATSPLPSASVPKPTPSSTKNTGANIRPADEPPPPAPSPPDRNSKVPAVPKTISGGVLNGKAISLPRPPYPPAARAVRAGGAVNVQVTIDERGNVISASAVSGHPLLQAAAVAAARGAKFTPTMLSGQAVKVTGVIVYNFVP